MASSIDKFEPICVHRDWRATVNEKKCDTPNKFHPSSFVMDKRLTNDRFVAIDGLNLIFLEAMNFCVIKLISFVVSYNHINNVQ